MFFLVLTPAEQLCHSKHWCICPCENYSDLSHDPDPKVVSTCPKNRKNRELLRSSDVWDSYDQCEHPIPVIPDIPDSRRFLRRDRKNRKHQESTLKVHPRWSLTSAIFTMSVYMKFACLGRRKCSILSLLATKA